MHPNGIIKLVGGACLSGRLSEDRPNVIQQVRANNSFYGHPWFDSVQVEHIGKQGQIQEEYAQLIALFQFDVKAMPGALLQLDIK